MVSIYDIVPTSDPAEIELEPPPTFSPKMLPTPAATPPVASPSVKEELANLGDAPKATTTAATDYPGGLGEIFSCWQHIHKPRRRGITVKRGSIFRYLPYTPRSTQGNNSNDSNSTSADSFDSSDSASRAPVSAVPDIGTPVVLPVNEGKGLETAKAMVLDALRHNEAMFSRLEEQELRLRRLYQHLDSM